MLSKTSSARDAVRKILELGEKISVQVVTLLWNWWLERNRVREGERRMEPDHLAYIVRKTSDEFLAMGSQRPVSAANRMKRWTRPPGVCLVPSTPPPNPNFPSHLHHIETLNITNDLSMEY